MQSLTQDASFAVAHVNMLAVANVRINPTPDTLWRYMELLEAELNDQSMAELQRNTKRPLAHLGDGTP
eukprot:4955573-Amphidinium_carterae.1